MMRIHPSAIIHPTAELADDVEVGPFSIIGEHVQVGAGTRLGPHMVVDSHTKIGKNNVFHGSGHIGCWPQDKKYANEPTFLEIGDDNTIFQFVTFSRGTPSGTGVTRIGNDNWIMADTHIAHDCQVGSHIIIANYSGLAGHVTLGDWVVLGGCTTVHQFCKIGAHAMTAFTAAVAQDVPPYVMAAGNRAKPTGINSRGLMRRGFTATQIEEVKRAYKVLYRQGLSLEEAMAEITRRAAEHEELQLFVEFFSAQTRGIIR